MLPPIAHAAISARAAVRPVGNAAVLTLCAAVLMRIAACPVLGGQILMGIAGILMGNSAVLMRIAAFLIPDGEFLMGTLEIPMGILGFLMGNAEILTRILEFPTAFLRGVAILPRGAGFYWASEKASAISH